MSIDAQTILTSVLVAATIVLAAATVILARHTKILAKETSASRKDAQTPLVTVDLLPGKHVGWMMYLVVSNVGRGAAFSVRFQLDADEADFEAHSAELPELRETPLNCLSPGASFQSSVGAFAQLVDRAGGNKNPLKPFIVFVDYYDSVGESYSVRYEVDICMYRKVSFEHQSVDKKLQRDVSSIASSLTKISNRRGTSSLVL